MEFLERINAAEALMKQQVAQVKTGVQSHDIATQQIHEAYMNLLNSIRYPGEPSALTGKSLTAKEIEMAQHFNQSDKTVKS